MLTCVSDPAHLTQAIGLVHDKWFDVDTVVFDPTAKTVSVPFGERCRKSLLRRYKHQNEEIDVQAQLSILEATSCKIEDTARIGLYDLNELNYDPEKRLIVVTSAFPLRIEVQVSRLRVAVRHGAPGADAVPPYG